MPTPGAGPTSPFLAGSGMSTSMFNTEYDPLDSDDGSPIPFLEYLNDSPDNLQSLEASRSADAKAHLSVPQNGATPESLPSSYQDTSSESAASSKRTQTTSISSKSLGAGDDVTMTDDVVKEEPVDWHADGLAGAGGPAFFDETIDPSSIENLYAFGDRSLPMNCSFDFGSASNSPSPFATTGLDVASPPAADRYPHSGPGHRSSAGDRMSTRAHSKGLSQYSVSSKTGLRTDESREVSPTSNLVFSQDSSPSALLQHVQSPVSMADSPMGNAAGAAQDRAFWLGQFAPPSPLRQDIHPALSADMMMSMLNPSQLALFQQPAFPTVPRLVIGPIPNKSRVETQIPIKLEFFALPPGIKRLHLPPHTISKPKLLAKPRPSRSPDMLELYTMLVCSSALQNADYREKALARARSAGHPGSEIKTEGKSPGGEDDDKPQRGGEVRICSGCITRERKRAARKKAKKPEEEENWMKDEHKRVIVFNTQEVKEWQLSSEPTKQALGVVHIDAPMRIACYCRHHSEKAGFTVIFTVRDYRDQVVAQTTSASIMITDDHKTHGPAEVPTSAAVSDPSAQSPQQPFRHSHSVSDLESLKRTSSSSAQVPHLSTSQSQAAAAAAAQASAARNLSRPASPTVLSGPTSKKRKASGSAKVPTGLAMTRLEQIETSHPPASQPPSSSMGSALATSPFSPSSGAFAGPDSLFGHNASVSGAFAQPFATGPPTPNSNDQVVLSNGNRSASLENVTIGQLYSAPTSSHASRAPSPAGLRSGANMLQQPQHQLQLAQALMGNPYAGTLPMAMHAGQPPLSVIHKIIPNEGPKSGGIEVTILGSGFYHGLEVMFGDKRATTTTFWGESSLVCLLPPTHVAGPVLVTFKQQAAQSASAFPAGPKQQAVFTYIDDDEQQLIRTALTVLSAKMNGRIEDAREIARRVVIGEPSSGASGAGAGGSGAGGSGASGGYNANFETQLLKLLEFLDLDDSTHKARLNLRRRTGQTMLHLACALGLHRFVAGLLARGATPDVRDKGGYTPMHMAAMNNHPEIVRRLIHAGADPTIRTIGGLTAADVVRSREVLRAIRRVERHARSRSLGSLHSRASSAASLRSLWETPSSAQLTSGEFSTDESEAAEESPEYTSGDFESEEGEADGDGDEMLYMRRGSAHSSRLRDESQPALLQVPSPAVPVGPASPTAAVAALRDQFAAQFHHLQQAMALQLQNLPQFPYLRQMPNFGEIPSLPDYQAYLNSAPVIQRITSLVPNIGGNRGGPAGDHQPPPPPMAKEMDGRWWDLSSYMAASSAPPPAYDELFPANQAAAADALDKKQASAARAAAEAEADSKCSILFDQQQEYQLPQLVQMRQRAAFQSEAVGGSSDAAMTTTAVLPRRQVPKLLQIGKKNSITIEQQEDLRRAHAEKLKKLSRDRNLFFIWIPLLLAIICAMLYSRFPGIFSAAFGFLRSMAAANTQAPPHNNLAAAAAAAEPIAA